MDIIEDEEYISSNTTSCFAVISSILPRGRIRTIHMAIIGGGGYPFISFGVRIYLIIIFCNE